MGVIKPSTKIIFADEKIKMAWESVSETDKDLAKQLFKAKEDIKENAFYGRAVLKKLIPKTYIKKYGIDNPWIYDLPSSWRLLYTIITPNKIEIISVVLNWMSHKEYTRLFKFLK